MSRNTSTLLLLLSMQAAVPHGLDAQSQQGPRFLLAMHEKPEVVRVDVSRTPILRRTLSLQLDNATIRQALTEIARQSGLDLLYAGDVLPLNARVNLHSGDITVAAALTHVLADARLDVVFNGEGRATLVKQGRLPIVPVVGVIEGTVTDAQTQGPVPGVMVAVEGTGRGAFSNQDGRYRILSIPTGVQRVTVSHIGYKRVTRQIEVAEGVTSRLDIALELSPTTLSDLVVTATGEQRRMELAHSVARIHADSVVREAPVSSLSELLNGRVPGLQVFTASGTVGGEVSLQVRTPNSILLGTEPIIIVDGIRYTSGPSTGGGSLGSGPFMNEATSRLNDLNPNNIESIEVARGPSATTLYGTDAANGVIVIKTKRGHTGPARWNAYARSSLNEIPKQRFPDLWWGWGSPTSNCALSDVAARTCSQDSVTVVANPLNDPAQTIFATRPRWEYGVNVAGGQQDFRYYVSGDFERAIGPIKMPDAAIELIEARRGIAELPEEQLEPNAFSKANLRGNVTAALGKDAELNLQTGYVHNATRTLSLIGGSPFEAAAFGSPARPYRTPGTSPDQLFAVSSTERVHRFFLTGGGQWRPRSWLQARGTIGLDLANSQRYSLARGDEAGSVPGVGTGGAVGDARARQHGITADLGVSALTRRGRFSFRTAVGAQYVRSLSDVVDNRGTGLPPGGESVDQAANRTVRHSYTETVTLGSYVEEMLGLNDRLFINGALRMDGASAFGRDYDAAVYPKAGVSWIVSEEPFLRELPLLDELRLRYAFGVSGRQALPTMALPVYIVDKTTIEGTEVNRIIMNSIGNPDLRPERVREHEFGFDASGLERRIQLGLTWFRRSTTNQILYRELPPGAGGIYTNLGLVSGRGFEAEFSAQVIETPFLNWRVSLGHAVRRSLLEDLGDVSPYKDVFGGSYAEGYPLGARFDLPIEGFADANGNGIIERTEVQLGTEPVYLGESTPPRTQTLMSGLSFFGQRLRFSALLERRSGFTQYNQLARRQCVNGRSCRAAVDPNTLLAEQAIVASRIAPIESGDFTRFRELSATVDLPLEWVQMVRLRTAMLSVAGRNLALWTDFSGPDPESAYPSSFAGNVAGGIPQARSWVLRLDVGF
jgi:TonB-linked SusC/RagA family outer membrane protein